MKILRLTALAVCIAAGAALGLPAKAPAAFCSDERVVDYAAPLASMPPLRPPPPNWGGLPFGPRGIALYRRHGDGGVRLPETRKAEFNYGLFHSRKLGAKGPIFVNWLVTAKLARVDYRGQVRKRLDWSRDRVTHLGRYDPTRLPLRSTLTEPGFYRHEIVFRNGARKRIGRFGEYIRVLKPSLDVRLTLNATSFRRGDTVVPCLENYGAAYLFFGRGGSYEYNGRGGWTAANFGNGPVTLDGIVAGPGATAAYWAARISDDAPLGRYRFRRGVDYSFHQHSNFEEELPLSAEFDVIP